MKKNQVPMPKKRYTMSQKAIEARQKGAESTNAKKGKGEPTIQVRVHLRLRNLAVAAFGNVNKTLLAFEKQMQKEVEKKNNNKRA